MVLVSLIFILYFFFLVHISWYSVNVIYITKRAPQIGKWYNNTWNRIPNSTEKRLFLLHELCNSMKNKIGNDSIDSEVDLQGFHLTRVEWMNEWMQNRVILYMCRSKNLSLEGRSKLFTWTKSVPSSTPLGLSSFVNRDSLLPRRV